MIVWPVLEREPRMRARQGTFYWSRCVAAAVASLLAVYSAGNFGGILSSAAVGSATFATLSWLGLLLAFAAFAVTADCLSVERRQGTLGLLFLTELRTVWAAGKLNLEFRSAAPLSATSWIKEPEELMSPKILSTASIEEQAALNST